MNQILTKEGFYLSNRFKGPKGEWFLVGTESTLFGKAMDCNDEFRNVKTGKRVIMIRRSVYDMAQSNQIYL